MQASQKSMAQVTGRRGRPPRLSREEIAAAVAEMLRADPTAPLTMARAAEAVGASAMSLYRHFADRDDLVVEVIRHVMKDAHVGAPADAPWQDRVRAWMLGVYGQVATHPQLFQGSAFGDSPAWLPDTAYLASVLVSGGFDDARRLAEAVYIVATTTLGHALIAATLGHELSLPPLYAGLSYLTPEEAEGAAALLPHLVAISKDGFALVADLTVAALELRGP